MGLNWTFLAQRQPDVLIPGEFETQASQSSQGCLWLPLLTSGNLHVRIEICMKYHLLIIFDNIQDYAGGGRQVIPWRGNHGNTQITAALQSELRRGTAGQSTSSHACRPAFVSGPACLVFESLFRLREVPPHI